MRIQRPVSDMALRLLQESLYEDEDPLCCKVLFMKM